MKQLFKNESMIKEKLFGSMFRTIKCFKNEDFYLLDRLQKRSNVTFVLVVLYYTLVVGIFLLTDTKTKIFNQEKRNTLREAM